ncbi:MAG: hypothetical protein KatS3mg068_2545 [Candidatus Sericytochromatia bacterium]|nr:MAG: hypothetical protein KatS3mg068_2545 [Candidatus Sericytochromatia bacterium]
MVWYKIPVINFTFQPSEIAKLVLVLYVSNILSNEKYYKLSIIGQNYCFYYLLLAQ